MGYISVFTKSLISIADSDTVNGQKIWKKTQSLELNMATWSQLGQSSGEAEQFMMIEHLAGVFIRCTDKA